jgi:hypothetical protein
MNRKGTSHPILLQMPAHHFVHRMSSKIGSCGTIGSIPDSEWHALASGFDFIWLMGVWQRSQGSKKRALEHPGLRKDFDQALPGWTDEDVGGSPYAIGAYEVDSSIGNQEELDKVRETLNKMGVGLILDFVPNHLALDHRWTTKHPQRFVRGESKVVSEHPEWFFSPTPNVFLAHGRDPNFDPWTDTAQINFWSEDAREALIQTLLGIASMADGVRCDMAMLALNDVFAKTWNPAIDVQSSPSAEFWQEAIQRVRQRYPNFVMIAEAYWGLEGRLIEVDFDFTYDKDLYDCLRDRDASDVLRFFAKEKESRTQHVHFVENHDEQRSVVAFGRDRSKSAALITSLLPGMAMFQDGQAQGRKTRTPVQLLREEEEQADLEIQQFYERLLLVLNLQVVRQGHWQPLFARTAWDFNPTFQNVLGGQWSLGGQSLLVLNRIPLA